MQLDVTTRLNLRISALDGVKKMFNDRFGFRSQLRVFVTTMGSEGQVYCDPYGCWGYEETTYFTQFEIASGLIIAL